MVDLETEALDALSAWHDALDAAEAVTAIDEAGLRFCRTTDRTTALLPAGTDTRCATCNGLLGRELVAVDAAGAVHCRVCEVRRLEALQSQVSPVAESVKP